MAFGTFYRPHERGKKEERRRYCLLAASFVLSIDICASTCEWVLTSMILLYQKNIHDIA
jgi:energy-converting hydrogenase Eha subunit C